MALCGLAFMMAASASGRPFAPTKSFQQRTLPCFSCSLSGTRAAQQYVQPVPNLEMLKQCLQHLLIRKSENAVVLLCSFPGTTAAYQALTESLGCPAAHEGRAVHCHPPLRATTENGVVLHSEFVPDAHWIWQQAA